jgi:hypothetical protein
VDSPSLRDLFHQLNNHLGVILALAELLEARAPDEMSLVRAQRMVASALDALALIRQIHTHLEDLPPS